MYLGSGILRDFSLRELVESIEGSVPVDTTYSHTTRQPEIDNGKRAAILHEEYKRRTGKGYVRAIDRPSEPK